MTSTIRLNVFVKKTSDGLVAELVPLISKDLKDNHLQSIISFLIKSGGEIPSDLIFKVSSLSTQFQQSLLSRLGKGSWAEIPNGFDSLIEFDHLKIPRAAMGMKKVIVTNVVASTSSTAAAVKKMTAQQKPHIQVQRSKLSSIIKYAADSKCIAVVILPPETD